MRIIFKMTQPLFRAIWTDLDRPHPFAAERVGFLVCRVGELTRTGLIVLAHSFQPVADGDYVDDPTVGARIGSGAFRKMLQFAYNHNASIWHVHGHDHQGQPLLSKTDKKETSRFMPDFFKVRPEMPHGAVVLSRDSATALCWSAPMAKPIPATELTVVGVPLNQIRSKQ